MIILPSRCKRTASSFEKNVNSNIILDFILFNFYSLKKKKTEIEKKIDQYLYTSS
jgi:hypothetical protein